MFKKSAPAPASTSAPAPASSASTTEAAEMTQRFAQFVMMQAQQVMMMLGLTPSPYGQMPPQLQEAKIFIDQLEMIQARTQGNLSAPETALLTKAIQQCSLAFTKASGGTPPSLMATRPMPEIPLDQFADEEESAAPQPTPARLTEPAQTASVPAHSDTKPEPDEEKKKFFKSYG